MSDAEKAQRGYELIELLSAGQYADPVDVRDTVDGLKSLARSLYVKERDPTFVQAVGYPKIFQDE